MKSQNSKTTWLHASLVILIGALSMLAAEAAEKEPNYVIFTIMGPQGLGPEAAQAESVVPETVWDAREKNAVEEIKGEFGEQQANQQRYVGFSVSLTPTLNLKPVQLKAQIVYALDLAERNKIPVFFHLDDQHFWWRSPELSHNQEMVEWSDFPKPGEIHGPEVPRYWLNWGDPAVVYPTPPPCFACRPLRAALAKRLAECVAQPIVQRLKIWKSQGKDYLFAGVASGNETKVPDFRRGYEGYAGKPGGPQGLDIRQRPDKMVPMPKEDMVPVGYHSLFAMGYDQRSIERLAQSRNTSTAQVVEELLYEVAHDYGEFQAKTLNEAGLPKERIYTHFSSSSRTVKGFENFARQVRKQETSGHAGSNNLAPPVESSINRFSRPGFTVVRSGVDLNQLVAQLSKDHALEWGKAWAAVESYVCTGQPGVPQTEAQYKAYLGGLLAHGAKVVNVYGWNLPTVTPYAVKGSGVMPVVKKWLNGEQLPGNWSSEPNPQAAAIDAKLAKLQATAHDLVSHGHDPRDISPILESFQREFQPLANAGKIAEAEAAIDRAIMRLQGLR